MMTPRDASTSLNVQLLRSTRLQGTDHQRTYQTWFAITEASLSSAAREPWKVGDLSARQPAQQQFPVRKRTTHASARTQASVVFDGSARRHRGTTAAELLRDKVGLAAGAVELTGTSADHEDTLEP
jgi:hypothetical protein